MQNITQHNITEAVLARLDNCTDPRLKELLTSLVRHLHAFVRETGLTEAEWARGIAFLTATGHITDARRQEFILLSDTLGVSMLTVTQNHAKPPQATESTVLGPFHVAGAPEVAVGDDISNGAPGTPLFVDAQVRDLQGRPVPHARIEVWQSDAEGYYDVQVVEGHRARGRLQADADGHFAFRSIVPVAYPIPTDGPVGAMLVATGRHPWRPAHVHFLIEAPGFETLITHVFRRGDPYLDSDVVFGVRRSLVADYVAHAAGTGPCADRCAGAYHTLDFDFVLNPVAVAAKPGE